MLAKLAAGQKSFGSGLGSIKSLGGMYAGYKLLEFGNFIDASGEPEASPFDSGRPRPFRDRAFAMRNTNGAIRQFRMSGLPVFDPETGRFRGYRGTARDVTAEATALALLRASRR